MDDLPLDSDGDALRRLRADGSILSRPMEIEFAVSVPNEAVGIAFAATIESLGLKTDVYHDTNSGRWTCYCLCTMIPSYDAIIATQEILKNIGAPLGANPDGWGSFGNAP